MARAQSLASLARTPSLAGIGDTPWGILWQLWLTVPVADTYTFAVYADDGFSFSGNGLSLSNGTTRAATTTETTSGAVMTPGNVYNFSLAYFNYTTATVGNIQLLWRRSGGALEVVPREAIHARGRKDYYSFGGAVVAMKEGVMSSATRTLTYLHGDHLGSVSLTTDASGNVVSQQRYKPYGEVRWSSGAGLPTDKQFTSQTRLAEGYVGTLYDYVARAYDPVLGRFISADTIVPGAGNPAALNRYAYVYARVLVFSDPTGHDPCGDDWCWRNRWFEAHGYFFDGQDWTRNSSLHARFRDPDILRDVISEVGAAFADGDANWQFSEQSLVGQGIVDFAHRVGGFDRLKELLGNGRTSLVRQHWFWGQRAHTDPPSGRNAYFHDTMFDRPNSISVEYFESNARGTVVHELAHIIDYQYDGLPGRARLRAAVPRQQDPVSDYAIALSIPNILYPGIENWAESATAWVYGNFYLRNSHQPLDVAVGDWIGRVLTGAGW